MLCPLRLGIKEPCRELEDVGFGDCYKDKCEWWIPERKDKNYGYLYIGHCAIHLLGLNFRQKGIPIE